MKDKTNVRMISSSQYNEWHIGDEGYIDGYVRGGNDVPHACVVIGNKLVMAPIQCVEVIKYELPNTGPR